MKKEFLNYIIKNKLFDADSKILLGISAGVDSVCLADLLISLRYNVEFAHCNFQLRGAESENDLKFVQRLAKKYNVPFHSSCFETNDYAIKNKLSIQMAARELRYNWFEELRSQINADCIAIAHNLDDKIETFFINIVRGTGIRGTISMKSKNGFIVRPLIFSKRIEIVNYVKINNLKYREDSSNSSVKYLRNKIRHQLIPLLKEINPSILETIDKEIKVMRNTFSIYEDHINSVIKKLVIYEKKGLKILKKNLLELYNPEMYVYEIFNKFGFTDFDSIFNSIEKESGKQFFSSTHRLLIDRDYIIMEKIENQFFKEIIIEEKQTNINNPLNILFSSKEKDLSMIYAYSACFDHGKLTFPLRIRKWRSGDKFMPLGMKNLKNLSDFFIDIKLDVFSKQEVLLLCSGNDIIWIIGYRIDERYKVTSKTKKMYIANLLEK